MDDLPVFVTCTAPVNMAVIKYWGKTDEKLIIPLNPSLSVTLNQNMLKTTTTVMYSGQFERDRIWVNGEEEKINSRVAAVLAAVRSRLPQEKQTLPIHICSENNFPTAAGLASSAAGYACLTYALWKLFELKEQYPGEISTIARQGSGSACRSIYGGFVRWDRGESLSDGRDSIAVQVAPETHWPELEMLICVVSDRKKDVASTSGMETSVKTSPLLQHRAEVCVPDRMRRIEAAIARKDFEEFGKITMQDSNQFHACCLDTYPPIFYMNHVSRAIIHSVTQLNEYSQAVKAAYTFDAGPNAVIFALKEHIPEVLTLLLHYFPPSDSVELTDYVNDPQLLKQIGVTQRADLAQLQVDSRLHSLIKMEPSSGSLKSILHVTIGPGPQELSADSSLLNLISGLPKNSNQ